jgi:hypothetical protein
VNYRMLSSFVVERFYIGTVIDRGLRSSRAGWLLEGEMWVEVLYLQCLGANMFWLGGVLSLLYSKLGLINSNG